MTIKVTEEMRQAALNELQGELTDDELAALHRAEVKNFETVLIPGQVKPGWEEVSEFLEQILSPIKEDAKNES